MLHWIHDRDQTPQGFPLQLLVRRVREVLGESCQLFVTRARGYGAHVRDWEKLLDQEDRLAVSFQLLEGLSAGTEEWFYDLEAACVNPVHSVRFGLHDSTVLFLEAPPDIARQVASAFKDVRPAER